MAETFGQVLRRLRLQAGLSKAALAEALGASRMSIIDWEAGKRVPRDRARLEDIAQILRLTARQAEQLAAAHHRHLLAAGQDGHLGTDEPLGASTPPAPLPGPAPRHQLRPPIADFVGRARESDYLVAALQAALARKSGAIISGVHGMGGIGKTELAYVVAHRVVETFPDAQIILNLRGTSAIPLAPIQALQQIIRIFAPDETLPDDLETVQTRYHAILHGRRLLILADDARDAAQVRPLLPPLGCALLVTSRQRFTLPGMASLHLEQLSEAEAATLLKNVCDRLSPADTQTIAHACGYLPLALRIGGGMLHNDPALLSATYIQRLTDARQRLAQLRDPDDGLLDVEASLSLSYTLLEPPAQQVFRQLGVFVADFTTELACAVAAPDPGVDISATLHLLLRRNLVLYDAARVRWRLHDLVRDLACSYLDAAGEREAAMWRYAQAAVRIAEQTQARYQSGGGEIVAALMEFDSERPHIDAARDWATAHAGTEAGDTLLIADALATYHIGNLRYDGRYERIPQLERALAATGRLGAGQSQGLILNRLGLAYLYLGDMDQAIGCFKRRLVIARAISDPDGEGQALNNLGIAYTHSGDVQGAIACYQQRLTIAQARGDTDSERKTLNNLGIAYLLLGETERAQAILEPALALARTRGNMAGEAVILSGLGLSALDLGDTCGAIEYFDAALTLMRTLGNRDGEAMTLTHLGRAALVQGDVQGAIERCEQALTILQGVGDPGKEGDALRVLGASYAVLGDRAQAENKFGAALALFRTVGDRAGEARCAWEFGVTLAGWGEQERARPFMRAAVTYEQEIGHARAAEHADLLARSEAGISLPASLHVLL